jgi:hypothetical protein
MKYLLLLPLAGALYAPGVIIKNYEHGKSLQVEVSSVQSTSKHIPFDYYNDANFCGVD